MLVTVAVGIASIIFLCKHSTRPVGSDKQIFRLSHSSRSSGHETETPGGPALRPLHFLLVLLRGAVSPSNTDPRGRRRPALAAIPHPRMDLPLWPGI